MPYAKFYTRDGDWFFNRKGQRLVCKRCGERPCRSPHGDEQHARDGLVRDHADACANPCRWCGLPVDPGDYAIDHYIPVARGGTDDLGNLAPAHPRCNSVKHARLLTEMSKEAIQTLRVSADVEGVFA